MSTSAQAIFYFLAFLGCLVAGFGSWYGGPARTPWGAHWGWLGLAAFVFVFFWTAVKAT